MSAAQLWLFAEGCLAHADGSLVAPQVLPTVRLFTIRALVVVAQTSAAAKQGADNARRSADSLFDVDLSTPRRLVFNAADEE